MIPRCKAIEVILDYVGNDDLVLSTTGMMSREVFYLRDRPGNFYMIGSMGLVSSLGLGLALLRPDQRVLVLDGDGSALMSLGALPLIGSEAPQNLLHIVLDNEAYESTGAQPSISSRVSIAGIGTASGYCGSVEVDDLDSLRRALAAFDAKNGPRLIVMKVGIVSIEGIPRVSYSPPQIRDRFKSQVLVGS
jgi:phosphonopyruvate decarboxylase